MMVNRGPVNLVRIWGDSNAKHLRGDLLGPKEQPWARAI